MIAGGAETGVGTVGGTTGAGCTIEVVVAARMGVKACGATGTTTGGAAGSTSGFAGFAGSATGVLPSVGGTGFALMGARPGA